MTLLELQRRVAAAIMVPLTPSAGIARRLAPRRSMSAEAKELIKPNDRLTSIERLEIYSRSYWFRLLDSFREDFPGLCAILGPRGFNRLAEAYLSEVPSQSFTMRNLGSRLEEWLRTHAAHAGKNPDLAIDMVRLEWAHIKAYDGAEKKALGPEDLLEPGPEMKIGLQPHITLLELRYPVDELRIRVQELAEGKGATSNMVIRRRERAAAGRCKAVDPVPTFLAVHRVDFTVYYKRLTPAECRILNALRHGTTLGEALGMVSEGAIPLEELGPRVENWFATWSRLAWLCSPEREQ